MAWWAPGWEATGRRLVEAFATARWGEPPAPFVVHGKVRPMRAVLVGRPPGANRDVFVKWSRPVTLVDRVARLAGGKGAREGRRLARLAAAQVAVPTVRGWTDGVPDLLVTEAIANLAPLPAWSLAPRDLAGRVGAVLGRAWQAGLRQRDLHGGNLGWAEGRVWLVDVGGGRLGRPGGLVTEIARARHGVFGDATRTQRLRALHAFLVAAEGGAPRTRLLDVARQTEIRARRVARRYRQGRDRRATRTGLHFEVVRPPGGGVVVRRREIPATWSAEATGWLEADPPGARALKAGGRVVGLEAPATGEPLVLKRYGATAPGRRPRAVTAFRMGVALEHRGIPVPAPLLAAAGRGRRSVLVSRYVQARDLAAWLEGGSESAFGHLGAGDRRAVLVAIGRTLGALHDGEVTHRDLKAPNLLVSRDAAGGFVVLVADLEGARVCRGPVSWRRRAKDLARLDASLALGRTDRMRVLLAYLRRAPPLPVPRRRFVQALLAAVSRKRGPAGLPR